MPTQSQTLQQWLSRLEALHPSEIELGLERVRRVFERLHLEQRGKIVTIAGTNGKGSCVATLEALALAEGRTVGAYTSPHFLRYNERVRINGLEASDEALVAAFEKIEAARGTTSLTYFEFGTLAAFILFAEAKLDLWILEVGLGGRLDAVNIVDPDIAVLTSVDLDHQAWLGNDREAIGLEKAGIFRAEAPAICVDRNPPQSVLGNTAGAQLLLADQDLNWGEDGNAWSWRGIDEKGEGMEVKRLPVPHLPQASVAAALQAAALLGFELKFETLQRVLSNLRLTGRRQVVDYRGRRLLLDVAHNPAAAAYLAKLLEPEEGELVALFGVMGDKDYRSILEALAPRVRYWLLCALPDVARAAALPELARAKTELGLAGEECDTVSRALARACALTKGGETILVVGSFYTVAAVLAEVDER